MHRRFGYASCSTTWLLDPTAIFWGAFWGFFFHFMKWRAIAYFAVTIFCYVYVVCLMPYIILGWITSIKDRDIGSFMPKILAEAFVFDLHLAPGEEGAFAHAYGPA